jgi:hypothetical protein
MKAITIWQPWASLIMMGAKQFETRSWETKHRGPLAIHAGASRHTVDLIYSHPIIRTHYQANQMLDERILPFSAVLGIALLVECFEVQPGVWGEMTRMKTIRNPPKENWLREDERHLGDFTPGRFAWELRVIEIFRSPIPARGSQGLWNWERGER